MLLIYVVCVVRSLRLCSIDFVHVDHSSMKGLRNIAFEIHKCRAISKYQRAFCQQ